MFFILGHYKCEKPISYVYNQISQTFTLTEISTKKFKDKENAFNSICFAFKKVFTILLIYLKKYLKKMVSLLI